MYPPTLPFPNKNPTKDNYNLTAQTNHRLLHVLSDLVKAFIDTELEIQKNLEKLGFERGDADGNHLSIRKAEDALSSLEEAMTASHDKQVTNGQNHQNNVEFADDFSFSIASDFSPSDISQLSIDDDVVLGASKRLRTSVDRILNLLKTVASIQENPPRNEESEERILKLEKELRDAKKMNQILQEEVNSKHRQLSSLKARIESTLVLDAQTLKDNNEQLKTMNQELNTKLALAEGKAKQFAEAVNELREELERRDQRLEEVSEQLELARDGSISFHGYPSIVDETMKHFDDCEVEHSHHARNSQARLSSSPKKTSPPQRSIALSPIPCQTPQEELHRSMESVPESPDVQKLDCKMAQLHLCVEKLIEKNSQLDSQVKEARKIEGKILKLEQVQQSLVENVQLKDAEISRLRTERLAAFDDLQQVKKCLKKQRLTIKSFEKKIDEFVDKIDALESRQTPSPPTNLVQHRDLTNETRRSLQEFAARLDHIAAQASFVKEKYAV